MPDVIVVGDGPAGLSARLSTAKNGLDTQVRGTDESSMHKALLRNYLGNEEVPGTAFMETAREQVQAHRAELVEREVVGIEHTFDGFEVSTNNVYAAGWTTRPEKIQAAVSVGTGAVAALDILSDVRGQPFRDFDTPPNA